jgi:hypothetical protein
VSRAARSAVAAAGIALAAVATPAAAGHSYTELYNPLYVLGVVLVVALSFVLVVMVVRTSASALLGRRELPALLRDTPVGLRLAALGGALAQAMAVLVLALVVVAGLGGSRIETWNIAPALVWVGAWMVMPAVQLVVGDVWAFVNPWRTLFDWVGGGRRPRLAYPRWLGAWPAVGFFVVLLWLEATTPAAGSPRVVGALALAYSLVTWLGMALFGAATWLDRGECFTVYYRLIAAAAPLEVRETGAGRRLALRFYAAGLLARARPGLDIAVFILLALAGGLFSGVLDTRAWESFRVARGWTPRGTLVENTAAFVGFVALTLGLYWLTCALVRAVAGPTLGIRDVALAFVPSFVPLAVGFHLTHGLDHTLENVQLLVRLVSDPLGFGWDVFGTRRLAVERPAAWLVWYGQLAVIVAVHVAGIWVAHVQALSTYPDRGAAIRSQVPMVGVMVLFTISGLWILSKIPILL